MRNFQITHDGRGISGDQWKDYCEEQGICPKCKTQTHRRSIFKTRGQPITRKDRSVIDGVCQRCQSSHVLAPPDRFVVDARPYRSVMGSLTSDEPQTVRDELNRLKAEDLERKNIFDAMLRGMKKHSGDHLVLSEACSVLLRTGDGRLRRSGGASALGRILVACDDRPASFEVIGPVVARSTRNDVEYAKETLRAGVLRETAKALSVENEAPNRSAAEWYYRTAWIMLRHHDESLTRTLVDSYESDGTFDVTKNVIASYNYNDNDNPTYPRVLECVYRFLASLSKVSDAFAVDMEDEAKFDAVFPSTDHHSNDLTIQKLKLRTLLNLLNEKTLPQIARKISRVCELMKAFPHDGEMQSLGCKILLSIVYEDSTSLSEVSKEINVFLSVMENHPTNDCLQKAAVMLLFTCFASSDLSAEEMFSKVNSSHTTHMMNLMETNDDNVPFLMEGCHLFATMATVKDYDTPESVVTFLSELMKSQQDDPKVLSQIYRALGNIVVSESGSLDSGVLLNGSGIVGSMTRYSDDVYFQQQAIFLVTAVLTNEDQFPLMFAYAFHNFEAILDVMQTHESTLSLQKRALDMILVLGKTLEGKKELSDRNISRAIILWMNNFPEESEFLEKVCVTLYYLTFDLSKPNPNFLNIASLIPQILRENSLATLIHKSCWDFLWGLFSDTESVSVAEYDFSEIFLVLHELTFREHYMMIVDLLQSATGALCAMSYHCAPKHLFPDHLIVYAFRYHMFPNGGALLTTNILIALTNLASKNQTMKQECFKIVSDIVSLLEIDFSSNVHIYELVCDLMVVLMFEDHSGVAVHMLIDEEAVPLLVKVAHRHSDNKKLRFRALDVLHMISMDGERDVIAMTTVHNGGLEFVVRTVRNYVNDRRLQKLGMRTMCRMLRHGVDNDQSMYGDCAKAALDSLMSHEYCATIQEQGLEVLKTLLTNVESMNDDEQNAAAQKERLVRIVRERGGVRHVVLGLCDYLFNARVQRDSFKVLEIMTCENESKALMNDEQTLWSVTNGVLANIDDVDVFVNFCELLRCLSDDVDFRNLATCYDIVDIIRWGTEIHYGAGNAEMAGTMVMSAFTYH